MQLKSYAKINLTLAVSPPEPPTAARPGWHRIASWFHGVDVWDDVHLSHAEGDARVEVVLNSGAAAGWPMQKDLGFRAVKALEQHVGKALPVLVRITKRIPAGGGLGGGSSNAATVLRGVNHLLDLRLSHQVLVNIGRGLGSDVEFFLDDVERDAPPRPAFIQGFGDHVTRVAPLHDEVTLFLTEVECPTPLVYQKFDELGVTHFAAEEARHAMEASLAAGRVLDDLLFNQLTAAASEARPSLRAAMHACAQQYGRVLLSGSGGTAFTFAQGHQPLIGITPLHTRLV